MANPSPDFENVTPNIVLRGDENQGVKDLLVHRNHIGFISCWKLGEEELEEVKRTGKIYLLVVGNRHPPVAVGSHAMDLLPQDQDGTLES